MPRYTFKSNKGDLTATVTAKNEEEARKLAMQKLWGPPIDIFQNHGNGLYLTSGTAE